MAVTDISDEKRDALLAAQAETKAWLEEHPPPPMPDYVSTVDGHVLRLDPSGQQYIVVSGMGDPYEARMTAQRLNQAAQMERALAALEAEKQRKAEEAEAAAAKKKAKTKKKDVEDEAA